MTDTTQDDIPESATAGTGSDLAPPALDQQVRMVEAILFASAQPMSLRELGERLPKGSDPAAAIAWLRGRYEGRGVTLEKLGDSYAFRTASDLSFLMQTETVEQRRLSRAAIETLAIIAYHQPVTRAEIEEIRGVAVSRGTLDQLIELDWVRPGRRRMTPGRPSTYVVTEAFLDHFALESARDLPGLSELRAAGLLDARPQAEMMQAIALLDDDDEPGALADDPDAEDPIGED